MHRMSTNQSVDRALRILWVLNGSQQATVTEIAQELQVHKSTASRLLAALERHRLVVRQPDDLAYGLGHGILQLASSVHAQDDLTRSAQSLVEAAAQHFKLTANVAIRDEIFAVNIAQSDPSDKLFAPRQYVGRRTPGHATSSGKVLLAFANQQIQDQILAAPLQRFTPQTITSPQDLRNELALVRERGWAVSDHEWDEDMTALGVPLLGNHSTVIAALTITGFSHDLPPETFTERAHELLAFTQRYGRLLH
jgi:DNA-binding IclR family transcriptional regulator